MMKEILNSSKRRYIQVKSVLCILILFAAFPAIQAQENRMTPVDYVKRDFKKLSNLSPQKWIIRKRLEVAQSKIKNENRKVSEVCLFFTHYCGIIREFFR
jgi:AraC-like DNA-binding protein